MTYLPSEDDVRKCESDGVRDEVGYREGCSASSNQSSNIQVVERLYCELAGKVDKGTAGCSLNIVFFRKF